MAVKTFATNEWLIPADVNTFCNRKGMVWIADFTATSGTTLIGSNCFSASYSAYYLSFRDVRVSFNTAPFFRLRDSGGDISSATYTTSGLYVPYSGAATITTNNFVNSTVWVLGAQIGTTSTSFGMYLWLLTGKTFSTQPVDSLTTGNGARHYGGVNQTIATVTGFTFFGFGSPAPTFTNATVSVYGVNA